MKQRHKEGCREKKLSPRSIQQIQTSQCRCLDKTKLLSSTNNTLAWQILISCQANSFCALELVLEPGVFGCRVAILKLVRLEYTGGFVVDKFS